MPHGSSGRPRFLQIAGILSVAVVAMQSRHLALGSGEDVGGGWNVVIVEVWASAKCIPKRVQLAV